MGFSTQLLLWSTGLGITVAGIIEPRWRGARASADRRLAVAAFAVMTVVWLVRFGFFAQLHLLYLVVTVVPAWVFVAALVTPHGRTWMRTGWGAGISVALLLPPMLGAYATHIEPYWLRTDQVQVVADAGTGLRIGVLADLQTGSIGDHERAARQRLLDADPDLILIPGDLWQTTDEAIVEDWPIFADYVQPFVDAVEHVVIVEGDTDHIGWIERIGAQTGAHVAHDTVIELDIDGNTVVVGGTRLVAGDPLLPPATAMVRLVQAEADDVLTIALAHRPDVIEWLPGRVDLVVSGHTHGGQVQLPFFGPIVTHSEVSRDVAAGGLHDVDGQLVYVSTGVGLERREAPQVRFNARPSIGVLDVVAG